MVDDEQNLGESEQAGLHTEPAIRKRRKTIKRPMALTLKVPADLAYRLKARVFSVRKSTGANQKTYSMSCVLLAGLKLELDRLDREEYPSMSLI